MGGFLTELGAESPAQAKTRTPRYPIMSHTKGCLDDELRSVSELRLDSTQFARNKPKRGPESTVPTLPGDIYRVGYYPRTHGSQGLMKKENLQFRFT